jgi:hypothetical protein
LTEVPRADLSLLANDTERSAALNVLEAAYADNRLDMKAFEARQNVVLRDGGVRRADLVMAVAGLGVDLYAPPEPAKDYGTALTIGAGLTLLLLILIFVIVL